MMDNKRMYDEWVASRRAAEPSSDLTGQVMASVERRVQPKRYMRLADRMNESRLTRFAACMASLLVGSLPIFFVAYVAQSEAF